MGPGPRPGPGDWPPAGTKFWLKCAIWRSRPWASVRARKRAQSLPGGLKPTVDRRPRREIDTIDEQGPKLISQLRGSTRTRTRRCPQKWAQITGLYHSIDRPTQPCLQRPCIFQQPAYLSSGVLHSTLFSMASALRRAARTSAEAAILPLSFAPHHAQPTRQLSPQASVEQSSSPSFEILIY